MVLVKFIDFAKYAETTKPSSTFLLLQNSNFAVLDVSFSPSLSTYLIKNVIVKVSCSIQICVQRIQDNAIQRYIRW